MPNAPVEPRLVRCPWAEGSAAERDYHDAEWGVPVRDERRLFEFLTLEGAQAGLSWRTVLLKREGYRRAFLDYDIDALAALTDADLEARLTDPGIVRNRLKVWSVRGNALAVQRLRATGDSLERLLWSFVDGRPRNNRRMQMSEVPARSAESDAMSKALQRLGFRFVGSTICYALMQAVGMVDDHLIDCPRHGRTA
jgi:DNA-3-methyladenine glycosylase I